MIDPAGVLVVDAEELLARFVVQRSHVRADQTVKPDAFIPHPHHEMSVTRHRSATEAEVWATGRTVAETRGKTLYGRADVHASQYIHNGLTVDSHPIAGNPNHANVLSWPAEKSAQKNIAQEIAAIAAYVVAPPLPPAQ